ncbi:hypothetical protein LOC50_17200 [Pseudoalteromonas sp. SCSIO 43095]|uniref:hypothetical protein n=1 Tax=Pseudoalteromonas TaxID=53246 RepID=UPI00044AF0AC|nr:MULTISPECIES: hypothetical protein [Pseudoalteromonas]EWS96685.1 hypothetical protein BG00_17280 [Pseudoalteromonas sp. SCSIO_11900]MBT2151215.1 hypothetical protein [Pseudoalteromonas tetraodonis]MCK8136693.1 hypothetical protein [Pseudoalteromonas sp. 2CM28B]MDX1362543.1 hypothetical protein [Pseudoalteromonas tetraodonis]MDX1729228.1 hypothetical protein [Pseudoalteromonas tetraodonis]
MEDLTEVDASAKIIKGKTTQQEIRIEFGSPYKTSYTDGGLSIWKYRYDNTSAFTVETVGSILFAYGLASTKSEGTRSELVMLFDENNVVKQFNMSNIPIESGTGLF